MEITPKPQPSAEFKQATLFVALELSKAKWLVALHAPDRDKVSEHLIAGGDTSALIALIEKRRAQAEKRLAQRVRIMSCYEAGYDGFWLHRFLMAQGIGNRVLDAASILVSRRGRRAKTDRLDVVGLLRSLMALARGETQVARVVHVPSIEDEDRRRLSRERRRLIAERVAHVNRIKGLLMLHGVRDFVPARRDWQKRLSELSCPNGSPLPDRTHAEITRECRRLSLVLEMIRQVEAEQADLLEQEEGPAAALMQLKGLGPTMSAILSQEVFFRDFNNRREIASYLGLAPSPWKSGGIDRDQGISKAGNRHARQAAIELAWLWLRHQPGSALAHWFKTRVGDMRGRVRRITIVALARKLIVALWRYLKHGLVPEGAVIKA
ncbi:MAG: IS110 family transposase [Hyphomicrobiaceae bacterium]